MTHAATTAAALLLAAAPDPASSPPSDPARQFDYWCGTWDIENTRLLPTGEQKTGGAALTVRPILGGRAILEQAWEGAPETDMAETFGMSLRWYDPSLERWVVILGWPGGDPIAAGFSRMEGAFIDVDADPQCPLYPPSCFDGPGFEPSETFNHRFIFSEATPTSLRWQLDVPWQGKVITAWDMRFTRTADPVAAAAPLEINAPPDECACVQPEARALDWLVGEWTTGKLNLDVRLPRVQTIRASSATRGCATLVSFVGAAPQAERFGVFAYVPRAGSWQAHSLDHAGRHAAWAGRWDPESRTLTMTATEESDADRIGETLTLARTGEDTLTLTIRPNDPESPPILRGEYRR